VEDAFNEPESTDTKIVVNGHPGYEYLLLPADATQIDWDKASKCTEEGGDFTKTGSEGSEKYTKEFTKDSNGNVLAQNTDYKILVRKSATDTDEASNPEEYGAYTKDSAPGEGEGYNLDYPDEIIWITDGYEIRLTSPEGGQPAAARG
jgi:hypothetical protein